MDELIAKQMDLVQRLDKGAALIREMEIELCSANEGKLPETLPDKYKTYYDRWETLLTEYEGVSRQVKAAGKKPVQIHFHAVCEFGNAVYAWVALDKEGNILYQETRTARNETNGNTATYQALIATLHAVTSYGWHNTRLVSCNTLIPGQMNGRMQCSAESLIPLKAQADALLADCRGVTIEHAPKEDNRAVSVAWNEYQSKFTSKKKAS